MAKILDLQAEVRTQSGTGAVKRMRKAGNIPAALYGRKVKASNIQVHGKTFAKLLEGSASDNILVSLKISGAEDQLALVQEVQHDYLRGGILHIDFHAVAADEEIHANVPVTLVGEAKGQKQGGLVEAIHHEIEVRCLPKDLPESIQIDVTNLEVGKGIHVSEISFPAGVTARLAGDVVIVMCEEPKVEAEPEPAAAAAAPAAAGKAAAAPAAAAAAKPAAKK
ncbi:50S ribosomal protein L25 [Prosthecobacter vanneervenii]|uniref:Large ribosomal subunit protein bL25 n=1 Tax=Prosthecobacter vanneervenii TaxID=48466 RepID=A0A7W8DJY0_9BACT|nr:50S ribosomal protein L25 [Prosthecobacter vanneervenii]MBB5032480.1 large subunit ribosomal protein L25 [Prosthecobacter vanneervenii]